MGPIRRKKQFVCHSLLLLALISSPVWNVALAQQSKTIDDKDIVVSSFAELEYPALARTSRTEGVVVVEAKLDDKGNVIDATALSGNEILITACLGNIKKWHFHSNPKKTVVVVFNFRITRAQTKTCNHFDLQPRNLVTVTTCPAVVQ